MSVIETIRRALEPGSELKFRQSDDGTLLECRLFFADGTQHAIAYPDFGEDIDAIFVRGITGVVKGKP